MYNIVPMRRQITDESSLPKKNPETIKYNRNIQVKSMIDKNNLAAMRLNNLALKGDSKREETFDMLAGLKRALIKNTTEYTRGKTSRVPKTKSRIISSEFPISIIFHV